MRLQETILGAITADNFERKEKNQFMLDYQCKYMEFDEVAINIKRQGSESYIDVNFGVTYDTDHCEGDNDTPPSSSFELVDIDVYYLKIDVDGLTITPYDNFKKLLIKEIKKILIFKIQ